MSYNRTYERVPFGGSLTVIDMTDNKHYEANGIDISVAGMAFYSNKFFPTGCRICVCFKPVDKSNGKPVWVNAVVVQARLEQNGAIMGARFDFLLNALEQPQLYEQILAKTM